MLSIALPILSNSPPEDSEDSEDSEGPEPLLVIFFCDKLTPSKALDCGLGAILVPSLYLSLSLPLLKL